MRNLKYEYSGPAKMACERLVYNAPAQLNEIREVISKAKNSHVVAIASEGIGNHGDPGRDVPLLIDAYARIYGEYEDEKVELALSKLTGLSLPEDSSPSAWKKQLAAEDQIKDLLHQGWPDYQIRMGNESCSAAFNQSVR